MRSAILPITNKALINPSVDVDFSKDNVVVLANKLRMALARVQGYGLAANQIGINKKMFVYSVYGKTRTIVNPTISEVDSDTWTYPEGCLSIPGYQWDITRPKRIDLVGFDLKGNEISIETTKLEARIFQHELDHLAGLSILNLLTKEQLEDYKKSEAKRINSVRR